MAMQLAGVRGLSVFCDENIAGAEGRGVDRRNRSHNHAKWPRRFRSAQRGQAARFHYLREVRPTRRSCLAKSTTAAATVGCAEGRSRLHRRANVRAPSSAFGKPNIATPADRRASSASESSVRSLGLRRQAALVRAIGGFPSFYRESLVPSR